MTLFFHELRRGKTALVIWSAAVAFMLGVCILIYPEMASQMGEISDMFANMGAFSDAFGMDQLNFGEFMGYFGIECGNTLGLGGALFAAILGASALAKEEREHTAELLLTHPLSRKSLLCQKLFSVLAQILIFQAAVVSVSVLCMLGVGVEADAGKVALLFLAHLLLQIEIAAVTFGLSAFLRRGELGLGLGLVFVLYFLNILSNLTDDLSFLKFITPFGYTDGSHIVTEGALAGKYLLTGAVFSAIGVACAFFKYTKKDIT